MLRKFFDPAAAEAKAEPRFEMGGAIDINEIYQSQSELPVNNNDTSNVEEKIVVKEEEKSAPVIEEKKEEVVEEKKSPVISEPDWRELVKKQNPKDVFSLLEIDEESLSLSKQLVQDEFVKKLVTYRQQNGNLTPFIEAATRDWDKVSQEQLILDDLKKQYSLLSSEKAEKLAKSDFSQRFAYKEDPNLTDEENQEMAELTALKLESEGARIRSLRKAEQHQFLDSVKPVDTNAQFEAKMREKQDADQKEFDDFKQMVESDPVTSKLFSEKKIVFGEKENSVNYTVNPDTIKEQTLDTDKFFNLFWKDGKFDTAKWYKVAAYANDVDGVDAVKINHGRSLSNKQIEAELENATEKTDQTTKPPTKKSLAKTFAEEGRPITLQELYGG